MDRYAWPNFVLLNWVFGPDVGIRSSLWFIEALFWITLQVLGLLSIPAVHRLYTRSPMRISLAVVVVALALAVRAAGPDRPHGARIGTGSALALRHWLGRCAGAPPLRTTSVAGLFPAGMVGYFADRHRRAGHHCRRPGPGVLPALALPRRLVAPASALAGASLTSTSTHFEVFAFLESSAVTP